MNRAYHYTDAAANILLTSHVKAFPTAKGASIGKPSNFDLNKYYLSKDISQ